MALILFTFVALLLCNCCLSEFHQCDNDLSGIENDELKITDLNMDELYLIFNNLDLRDWINTAEAMPEYLSLIRKIFRQKFSTYELRLRKAPYHRMESEFFNFFPSDKRFDVYDTSDFDLNVIKVFGSFFQKIQIDYLNEVAYPRWETVNKIVNKYCSESVKHLKLKSIDENILNQFTLPFRGIEEFTCSIGSHRLNTSQPLNKLFPNLRRLNLLLYSDSDYSFIDCEMPKLEHLTIELSQDSWRKHDQIEGLLRKSPNIRSIQLNGHAYPTNYIERIEQLLPNIEHLAMTEVNIETDSIHFENMKSCDIILIDGVSIEKLTLSKLESFRFLYSPNFFNEWQHFFQQHTNITHLKFQQMYTRESGFIPVNQLLNDLINLIDINFECIFEISTENIITFIQNHDNLQKLQFSFKDFTTNSKSIIRERFEKDWNIENINRRYNYDTFEGLSMIRK